jgi:hypothetical protein
VFNPGEILETILVFKSTKGKKLSSLTGACNSGVPVNLDSTLILASYAVQQIRVENHCACAWLG